MPLAGSGATLAAGAPPTPSRCSAGCTRQRQRCHGRQAAPGACPPPQTQPRAACAAGPAWARPASIASPYSTQPPAATRPPAAGAATATALWPSVPRAAPPGRHNIRAPSLFPADFCIWRDGGGCRRDVGAAGAGPHKAEQVGAGSSPSRTRQLPCAGLSPSLQFSAVCRVACCPPLPSRIAAKVAFVPPRPTSYSFIGSGTELAVCTLDGARGARVAAMASADPHAAHRQRQAAALRAPALRVHGRALLRQRRLWTSVRSPGTATPHGAAHAAPAAWLPFDCAGERAPPARWPPMYSGPHAAAGLERGAAPSWCLTATPPMWAR